MLFENVLIVHRLSVTEILKDQIAGLGRPHDLELLLRALASPVDFHLKCLEPVNALDHVGVNIELSRKVPRDHPKGSSSGITERGPSET